MASAKQTRTGEVEAVTSRLSDAVLLAAAWPGESRRGWVLPGVLAGAVAMIAGPRAGAWQVAAWGASPLGEVAKRLVDRPRPTLGRFNPLGGVSRGASFPSTHVANYVATFGFSSWLLWRTRSPVALPASITALILSGLIGPSRVRTGDHRWSDVAGGYLLGFGFLAALIAIARGDQALTARRRRRRVAEEPERRRPDQAGSGS